MQIPFFVSFNSSFCSSESSMLLPHCATSRLSKKAYGRQRQAQRLQKGSPQPRQQHGGSLGGGGGRLGDSTALAAVEALLGLG
jgi:hypothetical protein